MCNINLDYIYMKSLESDNGAFRDHNGRTLLMSSVHKTTDEVSTTTSSPVVSGARSTVTPEISSTCNGIPLSETLFPFSNIRSQINR